MKQKLLSILALLMIATTSAWAQTTYTLTLASNNTAMGRATVALQPKYELYDTFTPTSTEGSKTNIWCNASTTDGAWIESSSSYQDMNIYPSWDYNPRVTIHHATFYNANNQSVEMEPNDGDHVFVYFMNGNVYKDWEGTQLLISGGITKVEVYGMQMVLPEGVTATETAGVYNVVPGTEVPVAAIARRHHQFNNWSNNSTEAQTTYTMPTTAATLTANFASSPVLTLAANNAQMGSVEIPRHEGNGFLFEVKAADYAGQQSSIGNYQKFYFNTPSVDENSTVWTFNEDWSNSLMVNPEGFGKQRNQCHVVFVGPNGETYECDFKSTDFVEVYLKSGNTYSDSGGNNLLWQGGVASIECYGPGKMLPDGVDQISDNTFSVEAGTEVPAKATAKPRYSFVNWSNNSTEAQTTYTMPATAATLNANFAANPTLTLTANPATAGTVGFDFTPTPQTLTVNDGTTTNNKVPLYMNWLDGASTRGQHIIPAEQLGLMAGGTINSITYYHGNTGEWTSTSNINVYLKEVENTILTEYLDATTATTVYTGTLTETDGQMTITFSEPYTYQGGNLLVGFDNTSEGNYNGTAFYGVDAPSGSSAGDSNGTFTAQSFLPKSTFNYTPALPAGVIANTDGTYSVAAGTEFTLKAKPADDYQLKSWSNEAAVNDEGTQTITMGSANLTVTATFGPPTIGVTMAKNTEDAESWILKADEQEVKGNQKLDDVEVGTTVTATYNGTKKVKSVKAVKKADNTYLKWDADQKKLVATDIPEGATPMTSSTTAWAGTYVVEGDVEINANITLSGNVDLIIKDGAKLTAKQIYGSSSKYNLSIYGQANKTGQLVVNSSNDEDAIAGITTLEVHSAKVTATSSSGGCSGFYEISTFNVYGGSVDGENTGSDGYGILLKNNGSMNIYGGDVKAVGKGTSSYGIWSSSATVTVYGGKLWAENADKKAIDFGNVTLTKDTGYTSGKIEYSSDKSTWSETKDTSAKYVRVGY